MIARARYQLWGAVLLVGLLSLPGCINFAANMIHAITGNMKPAEYEGLKGKRVAIVVVSDEGMGNDPTSATLTSYMQAALSTNVKRIDLVRQSEVERWLDTHRGDETDYLEIGQGVNADCVVAVEVQNMTLKNGATLYQGKCDIVVSVFDVKDEGQIKYRTEIPEFTFPKIGGPAVTEYSEAKFRSRYLAIVAKTVSGLFYDTDATADFALDATANSF